MSNDHPAGGASILDAALAYHRRGWSIIPICKGTKIPACKWTKYQTERATEAELRKWFGNGQDVGLAVVFGAVSGGLACRDFDTMNGYERWVADHPELATTLPTVKTVRGRHVYFGSNHSGIKKLDDGELRGAGYCLLPPSRHPDGPEYRWLIPLPDGPVPFVADIIAVGLLSIDGCYTECAENAVNTGNELTVCSVSSMSSVYQGETNQAMVPERIERALRGCLPTGPGRRNRQVFELARGLKALPELADAAADNLRPFVERWHRLALPYIETKEFTESWIDFLQAWSRVKIPKGVTMANIMEKALRTMPAAAQRYNDEPIRRLVALCRQLGQEASGGPFFLSCRTAGDLLGASHVQANRWLFLLAHDGVVAQLNKGDRGRRKAAEYRYLPDDWREDSVPQVG